MYIYGHGCDDSSKNWFIEKIEQTGWFNIKLMSQSSICSWKLVTSLVEVKENESRIQMAFNKWMFVNLFFECMDKNVMSFKPIKGWIQSFFIMTSIFDTSLSTIHPFTFTSKTQCVVILQAKQKNMPSSCHMIFIRWHVEQVCTNGVVAEIGHIELANNM